MNGSHAISDLYTRMLTAADEVLRRPYNPACNAKLEQLAADVDRAATMPTEQRLVFEHERILMQALIMAERGRVEVDHGMAGKQIAGVLIPWVQEHAYAALQARKGTVPTSDGAGGGRSR